MEYFTPDEQKKYNKMLLTNSLIQLPLLAVMLYLFRIYGDNRELLPAIVTSYTLIAGFVAWSTFGKITFKKMIEENKKNKLKK